MHENKEAPPVGTRRIAGQIRYADGRSADGAVVAAFAKTFRTETYLGEDTTDRDGCYEIRYQADSDTVQPETLNVLIRVRNRDGRAVAESPVYYQAGEEETIDLAADLLGELGFRSEFDRLDAALAPLLGDSAGEELSDDELQLLAIDADVPLLRVKAYAQTLAAAKQSGLAPAPLYAFLRKDAAITVSALAAIPSRVLQAELEEAAWEGIIGREDAERTDDFVESLHGRLLEELAPVPGQRKQEDRAAFGTLLDTLPLAEEDRKGVARLFLQHGEGEESFWKKLSEQDGWREKKAVEKLPLAYKLADLTGGKLTLVQALLERLDDSDPQSALRKLAEWPVAAWTELLEQAGEPADSLRQTAAEIMRVLEHAMPTAFAAGRLVSGDDPLKRRMGGYLQERSDFNLLTSRIGSVPDGEGLLKEEDRDGEDLELAEGLRKLQRVYRLAGSFDAADAMLQEGVHSAYGAAQMGKSAFVERFAEALGGERPASVVYDKASQVTTTALMLVARYREEAEAASFPAALAGDISALAGTGTVLPTWNDLFGSNALCDCEHCRSVYGPAAYLADLLHFLSKRPSGTAGKNALAVLLERRPDLGRILLSCANTNVTLPYADLVNELLENQVSPATADVAEETSGTGEERAAEPEYMNAGAYDKLSQALYPWSLPYDLALDQTRAYMNHLRLSRRELMEAWRRGGNPEDPYAQAVAAEALGLTDFERRIVTGSLGEPPFSGDYDPWKFWGLSENVVVDENWDVYLSRVPNFTRISGFTTDEVKALLSARCINPDSSLRLESAQPDSTGEATVIVNLTEAALDRIHRFARLRLRLGWTITELDKAMTALGATELDGPFLVKLDVLSRLRRSVKLDYPLLLGWWTKLDTHPWPGEAKSAYERLFLNDAAGSPDIFRLREPDRGELADATALLDDHLSAVSAAIGVGTEELQRFAHLFLPDNKLNLEHLSALCRYVSLAKTLGLTAAELHTYARISLFPPFGGEDNALKTEWFMATVREMKATGVSAAEWAYLLLGFEDGPASGAIPSYRTGIWLSNLRAAFRTVASDYAAPPVPDGEWTMRMLSLVYPASVAGPMYNVIESGEPVTESQRTQIVVPYFGRFVNPDELVEFFGQHRESEMRFGYLAGYLSKLLVDEERRRVLRERLAEELRIDEATSRELIGTVRDSFGQGRPLYDILTDPIFTDSDDYVLEEKYAPQFDAVLLARKIARFAQLWSLSADELRFVLTSTNQTYWPELQRLPLHAVENPPVYAEQLLKMHRVLAWRTRLSGKPGDLVRLLGMMGGGETGGVPASIQADIAALTGWSTAFISYASGPEGLGLVYPYEFQTGEALLQLDRLDAVLRKLGVPVETARSWTLAEADWPMAQSVKEAVKSRYDRSQWLSVAKEIHDPLRERRRDALVSWLLVNMPGIDDADDLYARFLLDVEMSAVPLTSRIKLAISSVQLFVQRSLMNLETGVVFNADAAKEWQALAGYRTWEANRKLFLYPENWLEPDLRDDKSPFFREMEQEFLQGEATPETAETAFLGYLNKLESVSLLDICGMHVQNEDRGDGTMIDVVHVIGRTQNSPYLYFYRKYIDASYWTPWEKIDVDIEGNQLFPFVHNGRLILFWPIYKDVAKSNGGSSSGVPTETVLQVGIAWSEYRNGKWSGKTVAEKAVKIDFFSPYLPLNKEQLFFLPNYDSNGGALTVNCCIFSPLQEPDGYSGLYWTLFKFILNGSNGKVETQQIYSQSTPTLPPMFGLPKKANLVDSRVVSRDHSVPLRLPSLEYGYGGVGQRQNDTFARTPRPYRIMFPYTYFGFLANYPFIYQDGSRSYFGFAKPSTMLSFNLLSGDGDRLARMGLQPDAGSTDAVQGIYIGGTGLFDTFKLGFAPFYHPYASQFIQRLNKGGIELLLKPDSQGLSRNDFGSEYGPQPFVAGPYPVDNVDFSFAGSYAGYNWELFFHAPLIIADRLSKNRQFEQAQKWFHYIFNPTDGSQGPSPNRFWKLRPFYDKAIDPPIAELMELLQYNGTDPATLARKDEFRNQIAFWRKYPFNPHAIARTRLAAYQKMVFTKYLDNLIAWADDLFRQDTMEAINEAAQLYVLAGELLGKRPAGSGPAEGAAAAKSYNELAPLLDDFSNALTQLENEMPYLESADPGDPAAAALLSTGTALYFGIPQNERLFTYWDTVADRLYKIRHGMSIDGVARPLELFEPAIDPGLLARAAAAGIDLGASVRSNAPLAPYRYGVMAQKAVELCGEVRSFGAALLSAMEKRDAESLALLRSDQEIRLVGAMRGLKEQAIEEARTAIDGLRKNRELIEIRLRYYENLTYMNAYEEEQLYRLSSANDLSQKMAEYEIAAQIASQIPDFTLGSSGMASPVVTYQFGGSNISRGLSTFARFLGYLSAEDSYQAQRNGILAGYDRRSDEWKLQMAAAGKELEQIDAQIAAGEIRLAMAERELQQHELQMGNLREADRFMREKYTNLELYEWMTAQTSGLYFQSYRLAYEAAKRVERSFQFELGTDAAYVTSGHWDSLKKGLLAGERLQGELKRMEAAYYEQNKRSLEVTKHVSLALLDPLALAMLKESGACFIELPEALFDLDYPGHYHRRIKSVSLSIPCVTGPFAGVNGTLTLLRSSIRVNDALHMGAYVRAEGDDARFTDQFGINQSIVTSSAQHDAGMFDFSLRDERYLPFEGAGAVSRWRIELPAETNGFDIRTVSDVILHVMYSAKSSGGIFRNAVMDEVVRKAPQTGMMFAISARNRFSAEWHRFLHPADNADGQTLSIPLTSLDVPFRHRSGNPAIVKADVFLRVKDAGAYGQGQPLKLALKAPNDETAVLTLSADVAFGDTPHTSAEFEPVGVGTWTLHAEEADIALLPEAFVQTVTAGGTTHVRLKADMIEDLAIVWRYTTE